MYVCSFFTMGLWHTSSPFARAIVRLFSSVQLTGQCCLPFVHHLSLSWEPARQYTSWMPHPHYHSAWVLTVSLPPCLAKGQLGVFTPLLMGAQAAFSLFLLWQRTPSLYASPSLSSVLPSSLLLSHASSLSLPCK